MTGPETDREKVFRVYIVVDWYVVLVVVVLESFLFVGKPKQGLVISMS